MVVKDFIEDNQFIFKTLIENIPLKLFTKDLDLHYTGCSKDFAKVLRTPPQKIIGKTDFDLFPSETALKHKAIENKILAGLEEDSYEEKYETKNGEISTKITLHPVKNGKGKVIGLLGVLLEIPDKDKNPVHYENIFQTSLDGFCITDGEGIINYANDAICEMLGYERNELIGKKFIAFESIRNGMINHFKNAGTNGYDRFETVIKKKDKNLTHVEISLTYSDKGEGEYILSIRDISDRVKAEVNLTQSERRYQDLAEISPVGIFHTDVEGETTYVNRRWSKISGLSFEESLGQGWLSAVHPEDREKIIKNWNNTINDKSDSVAEYRFLHKDGSVIWVIGQAVPHTDSNGKIIGYLGTVTDVTRHKQLFESIRESEKLYRDVVENASDIIYSVDVSGRFTYANKAALKASGYSLEEINKLSYFDLALPEYHEKVKRTYFKQHLSKSPNSYVEFPFKTKSGEIRWFGQSASLKNEEDKTIGFQIIARDITAQKLAEEALRQKQILLRTLIDSAPDAIYIKDEFSRKTLANLADVQNMGLQSEAEVLGKDDFELFPKKVAENFYKDDQFVLQTGQPVLNRVEHLQDQNGKEKWILTSKVPLRDDKGRIIGLVGIGHDFTEKRNSEEALKKNEKLFRTAQRIAKLGSYCFDIKTGIWESSEVLDDIFGIDNTFEKSIESWLHIVHPDDRERMRSYLFDEVIAQKKLFDTKYRIIRINDGALRWVRGIGELEFDENENLSRMIGAIRDITDRVKDEEQIKKLNRLYAVLSSINKSIVRIRDVQMLMESVCEIAVSVGNFQTVWIGKMVESSHQIDFVAHAGKCDFNTQSFEIINSLNNEFFNFYPPDKIFSEQQHQIYKLYPDTGKLAPHHGKAFQAGCRSYGSFPLKVSGKIWGSVNLYSSEPDFFDEEEIKLLDELIMDISFALEFNEQETRRKNMEEELRKSEERFRSLYENSTVGIYRTTPDGKILLANPTLIKILGFTSFEELSKRDLNKEGFEESMERKKFVETIEKFGEIIGQDSQWKKDDGTIVYLRESAKAMRDENGKTLHYDGIIEDVTERTIAENALKTSERRLTDALEIAMLGHWEIDLVTNKFVLNDQFYKLLHTTAEEQGGYLMETEEYFRRFLFPEDANIIASKMKRSMDSTDLKVSRQLEHKIRLADGKTGYIAVRLFVIRDNNGKTIRVYGVNQDITERKLAEEKIIRSEQEYRRLFDNAHDAILILNPENEIVLDVNERACELYGFSKSEFLGMSLEKITKDVEAGKNKLDRILQTGVVDKFETVQYTKYGKELIFEVNASLIEYRDGKAILSLNHDITDRKRTENELEFAYEQLSSIYANIPEAIFSFDQVNKKMMQVSPAHESVFGYPLNEFYRNPDFWYEIIIPEDKPVIDAGFPLLAGGKSVLHQYRIKRPDGKIDWIESRVKPILDNNGNVIRIDGIAGNITERKKAEEEIISAKEKAEEMNRLKTIFLTNMSHELRTPLIGLLGLSEFLADEVEDDLKDSMEMINKSGQRLLRTLSTILDYSKLESERIEINLSAVSVTDLLKEQIKLFQPLANSKGVNIIENFDAKEIKIFTDEKLIYDIINNLINNAVKFTSQGAVTVSSIHQQNELILKVSDTGIGIPEEKLDIIFEEFRQVSEGTNRSFEGTGLGLSIVKKYVNLLNGNISVESQVGEGSSFIIHFPLNQVPSENDELTYNSISNEENKKPDKDDIRLKNILLVEDDLISGITIEGMLKNNYKIYKVNNAIDAINSTKNEIYDAILMDINLGRGMDGIQATKEIRKVAGYENIPIFAMTAFALEEDKEEFLKGGCSHYIAKPFTKKEILEQMDLIFDKTSVHL